ncbi:hypothetical protein ABZX88_06155 [Kitasatospora aureofaciens]|uniref:hypothetical protein n=1 Tax=Kitasatospora aureofaciens TaxID=1894 RepID=UPI00339F3066
MSLATSQSPIKTGLPVNVKVVRPTVAIGTLDCENLLYMVNDPVQVEQEAARDAKAGREVDDYAKLRQLVQRMIATAASPKAKNVASYAEYISAGLRGDFGTGWSIPPITLWCLRPLAIDEAGNCFFPIRDGLIAIDGETQITALHRIRKNPAAYGLEGFDFGSILLAFEVYHGIPPLEARQIFHDRNNLGAPVDKSLAMSMDMRDFGTTVTQALMKSALIPHNDREVSLETLIVTGKRQVSAKSDQWLTLQGLRTLVATTMLGKSGIHAASDDIEPGDIKDKDGNEVDKATVQRHIVETLGDFLRDNAELFHNKTAITAPAVLAGLGALLHHETPWATDAMADGVTVAELLKSVRWDREAAYWGGIAAKVTDKGNVTWGGGARDSGHKVYEALSKPASEAGHQVRGLIYTTMA